MPAGLAKADRRERAPVLLELIRRKPGISMRALRNATGWSSQIVAWGLGYLEGQALVDVIEDEGQSFAFCASMGVRGSKEARALANPHADRLWALVAGMGPLTQGQVLERARGWGLPASSARRYLDNLVDAELLQVEATRLGKAYAAPQCKIQPCIC